MWADRIFFFNKYTPYCKTAEKNFLPKLAELRREFLAVVSIQIMVFVDITPSSLQLDNEISDHLVPYTYFVIHLFAVYFLQFYNGSFSNSK